MAQISFKNVGTKGFRQEDVLVRNKTLVPIGIKTPIEMGSDGFGIFVMNTDIKDQIADNLKNLVLTNWGERLGNYFFGANLRPLLADFSHKENFDEEAMVRINTAISKYMPFVTPVAYESKTFKKENSPIPQVKLILIYSITNIGLTNAQLEIDLFVI